MSEKLFDVFNNRASASERPGPWDERILGA